MHWLTVTVQWYIVKKRKSSITGYTAGLHCSIRVNKTYSCLKIDKTWHSGNVQYVSAQQRSTASCVVGTSQGITMNLYRHLKNTALLSEILKTQVIDLESLKSTSTLIHG